MTKHSKASTKSLEKPQDIGFVMRSMAIASMPHGRVKGIQYKRRNGDVTLTITGQEESGGIPYGSYPRLILLWVITEVTRTRSREIILGNSLSDFMRQIGIQITGGRQGTIARFKDQLQRLLSSHITVTFINEGRTSTTQMMVVDHAHIFWDPTNITQSSLFKSKIHLGEAFYNEIIKRPIPVDLDIVSELKDNALALDIYFWLTCRIHSLKNVIEIPFEKLYLQFGGEYQSTRHGKYEFKRKFLTQLHKVLTIYHKARVHDTSHGITLSPRYSAVSLAQEEFINPFA